jgi:predicted dehydrogenase
VATRHNLHYEVARAAVLAGKSVFVEKPMAMTSADASALVDLVAERKALLTVGFNRRFSPHAARLAALLAPMAGPKTIVYRVNAGALPPEAWVLDPVEGGGRLLGEGVHFFDLLAFLTGAAPVRVHHGGPAATRRDEGTVAVEFADGSVGTLIYAVTGGADLGKERVEVFAGGASFVLEDYRALEVHGVKGPGTRTRAVEKGQREQLENFYRALKGEAALGVTAADGLRATWCAEQAIGAQAGSGEAVRPPVDP